MFLFELGHILSLLHQLLDVVVNTVHDKEEVDVGVLLFLVLLEDDDVMELCGEDVVFHLC